MENISTDGNQRTSECYIWCRNKLEGNQLVYTAICIAGILVDTLILIALRRVPY